MSDMYDSDEVPFDVTEEIEVGDLNDQQGGVLDPAQRVPFTIRKASVRTQKDKDSGKWTIHRLVIEAQVGPDGTDGEGKYAGKVLFPEFILALNTADFADRFASDWWKNQSRYPTKAFFKAMDVPLQGTRINDDFLFGLTGREFVADIKRSERRAKGDNGKWAGTGEFENELTGFRAALSGGEV
jgi:hypothetical protein